MINPHPSSAEAALPLTDLEAELPLDDDELAGDDAAMASAGVPAPAQDRVVQTVISQALHGRRVDQILVGLAPEFSRNHLQQLIEQGCVTLDGKVVSGSSRKAQAGQQLQAVLKPTAQSQSFAPEAMDLPVVFEDEHLLVVNKPVGLVVHPAAGHWQGTLMNGLLAHHPGAMQLARAGIVHRLDKDTSGLMVVGKTVLACTALTRAIAAREVHRQYKALVWGQPPASLRIDAPIGRDPISRVRMAVVASGKPAMTDVLRVASAEVPRPNQASTAFGGALVSAVECTLHTGRTHQIRVHLASRRSPLVADAVYGGAQALGMRRQALHAFRLSFAHPADGRPMVFESPLPEDMAQAWAQVVHNGSNSV